MRCRCTNCGKFVKRYGLCDSCKKKMKDVVNIEVYPVEEFKDQEELDYYLEWWQEKLFLKDWMIFAKIVPMNDFECADSSGECLFVYEKKEAVIHIIPKCDVPKDSPFRFSQEKILVHELLHCKYNYMMPPETYEGKYLDVHEHQKLEEMAKTLIMTKYNLNFDWFKADDQEDNTKAD